jgi:hypothetical protein
VTDYEFEIEFKLTLTMHTYSYDGFYFRKRTFKHLPLTQIKFLEINRIFKIDNDIFSNLTDIQTLLIWMGSKQSKILNRFHILKDVPTNIIYSQHVITQPHDCTKYIPYVIVHWSIL